jgi:hypothetical protein
MRFPSAPSNGGEIFLKFLDSNISEKSLNDFLREDGFNWSLRTIYTFPENEVRKVLSERRFPSVNLVGFGEAIYECGLDRMRTYDRHLRIFASSIYVYVRHLQEWGGDWQGEYCYLMIADSIQNGDAKELRALLVFFEWLCTHTVPSNSINDYPLLISWLLVKYRLGEAQEDFVRAVENYLISRMEDQYLLVGDSWDFGVDEWLELSERIPDAACVDRNLLWDLIYRPDTQAPRTHSLV